jgi:hypothetical protein
LSKIIQFQFSLKTCYNTKEIAKIEKQLPSSKLEREAPLSYCAIVTMDIGMTTIDEY